VRILSSLVLILMLTVCARQPSYPQAPQEGSSIVIEAVSLEPEVPKFYSYRFHGKNISYFVLKTQGKVLSFLDACASCYPHKKGYRYDDGAVTCRYCNMKFPISKLEKGLGRCYPIKIEGTVENGKYLIPVSLLEGAADKF
ncbi:MAG: Fe-S-containing protein, partial [Betaproteobacteria bacterium]